MFFSAASSERSECSIDFVLERETENELGEVGKMERLGCGVSEPFLLIAALNCTIVLQDTGRHRKQGKGPHTLPNPRLNLVPRGRL